MAGTRQMRFARIWAQASERLNCCLGHGQTSGGVIDADEIESIMRDGQLVVSQRKTGITLGHLAEQANSFDQTLLLRHRDSGSVNELFGARVKIECHEIGGGLLFDGGFFFGRKFAFELISDLFGQLESKSTRLNSSHVSESRMPS